MMMMMMMMMNDNDDDGGGGGGGSGLLEFTHRDIPSFLHIRRCEVNQDGRAHQGEFQSRPHG